MITSATARLGRGIAVNRMGKANTTDENRAKQILVLRGCGRCGRRLFFDKVARFEYDMRHMPVDVLCEPCVNKEGQP